MQILRMPEAVKGMSGATVARWLIEPGQSVEAGAPLVELEVENAFVQVEAPSAGTLSRTLAAPGTTVKPGDGLAELDSDGGGGAVRSGQSAGQAPAAAGGQPAGALPAGVTPILMPQAGNTMEEGTVLSWKVKEGEQIEAGQVICEIETDKATMEFESPEAGRLARITVGEGETIAVKQPIAFLSDSDEAVDAYLQSGDAMAAASSEAPPAAKEQAAGGSAPPEGAVTPLVMPQAGNTMEEGTILSWKVKEGETIEVGQIICEIETDKATMEYESPEGGRLAKIVAGEGETVAVKELIALIADSDSDAEAFLKAGGVTTAASAPPSATPASSAPARPAPAAAPASRPSPAPAATSSPTTGGNGRIKASPAARRMAKERGLDLSSIGQGSGPGGRILSSDLDRAKAAAAGGARAAKPAAAEAVIAPAGIVTPTGAQPARQPMTKMRRAIAVNLQRSKQTVPHFYVRLTIDADPLFRYYREHKPATGCTINDVIVLAVGRTMAEFPAVRSQVHESEIVEFPHANIGIAVGVPDGLVVPVVMRVDTLRLDELAKESKRVVENARNGKLENIGQGNFTISNLGMFGVEEFAAIINPPESGILSISALRETVLVKDGAMRPGKVMTMTLSSDHRIVDGLVSAQYLARLKEVLEHPQALD